MTVLSPGQHIADRYRLDRRIAIGGMGEVWEASDTRLDRSVAVKVLRPELSDDAEFLHRFRIEARTVASLDHSGIASVHDYGEDDGPAGGGRTAYLVMELVRGEPLSSRISRGPLDAEETLRILEQAAWALQAAHQRGFVHRDVKPGNILLRDDGVVKLTDFGIAKAANAVPVTRSGMVMGTAHYIAPEQASGGEAGPAGDVYSLGIVGYECLAGHRPFRADNAVAVAMMQVRDEPPPLGDDVPARVRNLIDTVLVKDPRYRYGDGGEFAAAVAAVRSGAALPRPTGMPADMALPDAVDPDEPVTGRRDADQRDDSPPARETAAVLLDDPPRSGRRRRGRKGRDRDGGATDGSVAASPARGAPATPPLTTPPPAATPPGAKSAGTKSPGATSRTTTSRAASDGSAPDATGTASADRSPTGRPSGGRPSNGSTATGRTGTGPNPDREAAPTGRPDRRTPAQDPTTATAATGADDPADESSGRHSLDVPDPISGSGPVARPTSGPTPVPPRPRTPPGGTASRSGFVAPRTPTGDGLRMVPTEPIRLRSSRSNSTLLVALFVILTLAALALAIFVVPGLFGSNPTTSRPAGAAAVGVAGREDVAVGPAVTDDPFPTSADLWAVR